MSHLFVSYTLILFFCKIVTQYHIIPMQDCIKFSNLVNYPLDLFQGLDKLLLSLDELDSRPEVRKPDLEFLKEFFTSTDFQNLIKVWTGIYHDLTFQVINKRSVIRVTHPAWSVTKCDLKLGVLLNGQHSTWVTHSVYMCHSVSWPLTLD